MNDNKITTLKTVNTEPVETDIEKVKRLCMTASEEEMESVVILGFCGDDVKLISSESSDPEILWLFETARTLLVEGQFSNVHEDGE